MAWWPASLGNRPTVFTKPCAYALVIREVYYGAPYEQGTTSYGDTRESLK